MELGYSDTTIDEIADRLNATKGRIYHYYRSKADIFLEVQTRAMDLMIGTIKPVSEGPGTPTKRIAGMARHHALLMMTRLPLQRVSVQGVERHLTGTERQRRALKRVVAQRDEYEELFAAVIRDGIETGEFADCDPRLITKPILGALNWITVWYRQPRRVVAETAAREETIASEFARFIVAGLQARE